MKKLLLVTGTLFLMASPVTGQHVSDVVVFGDSLSDTGNIPILTSSEDLPGGVNFPPSPPYADNRFSNGPVYSELLPPLLGLAFDPTLNFAVGGALTGTDNLGNGRTIEGIPIDPGDVVLPGIQTQVDTFLADGGRLDHEDLVIIYGGANDVSVALGIAATLPPEEIPALVLSTAATSVQNLTDSVRKLHAAGGKRFILPDLPDLGATPNAREGGPVIRTLATGFTLAHNLELRRAVRKFRDETDAHILLFNVSALFSAIRLDPERFGITNTTDACLNTPTCAAGDVDAQNQFLFFDGIHPTTGVHETAAQILADIIDWGRLADSADVQARLIDRRR